MKPVVSSLVALVLAIAPVTAFAKPAHKTAQHKIHHSKVEKTEKTEKTEKSEIIVPVKAGKKDGAVLKPVVHHAHNVDLGGAGHKEPKVDAAKGGALVPASMTTKTTHTSTTTTSEHHAKNTSVKASKGEMPKLPNANAGKPSKGGAEKGARKPSEKKAESADSNDGEPTRDEEFAELVAQIRGTHRAAAPHSESGMLGAEPPAAPETKSTRNASHTSPLDTRAAKTDAVVAPARREPACSKDPVEIVRGPEIERFHLTKCDGSIAPLAVEHLSVLIRPGGAARPTAPANELAKKPGQDLAPGIRRVDTRLVERIQTLADHFGKQGSPAKLFVISGYRPASVGSMHSSGRAIDFRIEGAKNEDVVAYCKTLNDTGCGYYPNSSFVHVDVRDVGAGHVSWIDASGPGETPRYVSVWPPPASAKTNESLRRTSATTIDDLAEQGASLLKANRPFDHELGSEAIDSSLPGNP